MSPDRISRPRCSVQSERSRENFCLTPFRDSLRAGRATDATALQRNTGDKRPRSLPACKRTERAGSRASGTVFRRCSRQRRRVAVFGSRRPSVSPAASRPHQMCSAWRDAGGAQERRRDLMPPTRRPIDYFAGIGDAELPRYVLVGATSSASGVSTSKARCCSGRACWPTCLGRSAALASSAVTSGLYQGRAFGQRASRRAHGKLHDAVRAVKLRRPLTGTVAGVLVVLPVRG